MRSAHLPVVQPWLHSFPARPEDLCKIHPRPRLQCSAVRPIELLSYKIRGTLRERASRNVQQRVLSLTFAHIREEYLYFASHNQQVIGTRGLVIAVADSQTDTFKQAPQGYNCAILSKHLHLVIPSRRGPWKLFPPPAIGGKSLTDVRQNRQQIT